MAASIGGQGRPAPGSRRTTTAPHSSNSAAIPLARGDGHHSPAGAGASVPLGQVGDPDPVRPPTRSAASMAGPGLADVHVDVPQPLAADHDQ